MSGTSSTGSIDAPGICCTISRYHAVTFAVRPFSVFVPHTIDSAARVPSCVLVRYASLTGVPVGPWRSNRHTSPPTSITCPDGLNTYVVPGGAIAIEKRSDLRVQPLQAY